MQKNEEGGGSLPGRAVCRAAPSGIAPSRLPPALDFAAKPRVAATSSDKFVDVTSTYDKNVLTEMAPRASSVPESRRLAAPRSGDYDAQTMRPCSLGRRVGSQEGNPV